MIKKMMIMNHRSKVSLQGPPFDVLVLLLVLCSTRAIAFVGEDDRIKCIERERQALLAFKHGVVDEDGYLSSWETHEDCCKWRGVGCSNRTGHVVMLNLDSCLLQGNISSSLLALQHLKYLDLSGNDFGGSPIPKFIGSLTRLRFLDLSDASFSGRVPYNLGNLTDLQSLKIGYYIDFLFHPDIKVRKLEWLSHLFKLTSLSLNRVDLSKAIDWVQVISELPSLRELDLSGSQLPRINHQSLSLVNSSTTLARLHLMDCGLSNSARHWLPIISKSLVYLDASSNNFHGHPIPDYVFGNMVSLAHLDLSANQISGISESSFPISLLTLCLSYNNLQGPVPDYAFRNMTCLVHLKLDGNQITAISKSFADLCSLKTLEMSYNNLTGHLPNLFSSLSGCAKKSLEVFHLNRNMLTGSFPDITEFSSLKELVLLDNKLNGSFPETFKQPSPLVELDLRENQLQGPLPHFSFFPSLRRLSISFNRLNGTVNEALGQLSQLEELDLYSNSLQGMITESHLSNLSKLKALDFSHNSLALKFSPDWIPPFQLDVLRLRSCTLGPHFPNWLRSQNNCRILDLSNTRIFDTVPSWFWHGLSSNSLYLNLSHNQMKGEVPDLSSHFDRYIGIDLSSNCFEGPIPPMPSRASLLFLSENKFSGSLAFLCYNNITLQYLDLSYNQLSGKIPDCSRPYWSSFRYLSLANNNFSGRIPDAADPSCQLSSLHLRNNSLTGELPSSLRFCMDLSVIDSGNNKISGTIPPWIGDSLQNLVILSLRSNHIIGSMPPQICELEFLKILDVSENRISGRIPKCLNNLTAMKKNSLAATSALNYYSVPTIYIDKLGPDVLDEAWLVWKGVNSVYRETLGLVRSIDLSSNDFCGRIPEEVTSLVGLLSLNLSRNNLTGPIPPEIGRLILLDALDLSQNQLSGEIPESTSRLNLLGVLDLSSNNLSGKIPPAAATRFEASSYMGNLKLCGFPLPKKCPGEDQEPAQDPLHVYDVVDGDGFITEGFYISSALGFIIAFWGFCGVLMIRKWRRAYFRIIDDFQDKLYVFMHASLKRRLTRS